MRDLSDLNDLYNAQDVIILLEIIENRFQTMQDKTGYNPRIINSASKLSGCMQRENLNASLLFQSTILKWKFSKKHYAVALVL